MMMKRTNLIPHLLQNKAHNNLTDLLLSNNSSMGTVTPTPGNVTVPPKIIDQPPCQWILYTELGQSRVRLWDLIILIPNVLFLLFIVLRLRTAYTKLKHTNSPIFFAFYGMVFLVAIISVLRCVVSMTVNAAMPAGDIADKVLWLILRFFLLATELSVVIFGLAFGHLDSRTSIRRVLLVTCLTALAYSITQGALEFLYPDTRFHVNHNDREYDIFGHGGMLFWFASSVFFFVIYTVIFILPWTKLRDRFALPTKKSFYWYSVFLSILNLTQAIGSGLLYYEISQGMCIVDVTAYMYFTCFAPLVYITFLREFFATSQPPNILFSYKAQVDEGLDEDQVSLPYQTYNNEKTESELQPTAAGFNSTRFDISSPNPLYAADMQLNINGELTMSPDYYGNSTNTVPNDIIT